MSSNVSDNNNRGKYSEVIVGLYRRNKMILALSASLFIGFLFLGMLVGYFSSDFIGKLLKTYISALRGANIEINTFSIFIHSLQAALISFFGGIIGIITFLVLTFNGFVYGAFIGYLMHGSIVSTTGVLTPLHFIIYTMPHGIFELTGFIIAGAAGFRITTLVVGVIKSVLNHKPINEHYWKLKDALALLLVAIVLIFIAAFIEANITMALGNYITGLNY
jgi:stage II sporulation protein M